MQAIRRMALASSLTALAAASFVFAVPAAAVNAADPSDVVIALDVSGSILDDRVNRQRFADALDRIAGRVDETVGELVGGDATVSLIQFASRAADVPRCTELSLEGDHRAVVRLADCLREVATTYRQGRSSGITRRVGNDTNYVAVMELAAEHLPRDARRPALILFTDGKHDDPNGTPAREVIPARDRLFGDRSPFAMLPVGMGLAPGQRDELQTGLERLLVVRDMRPCDGGQEFRWDQVVFESAEHAGVAVATALQQVTCTFTVAPSPPSPQVSTPSAPQGLTTIDGDASITLRWSPPVDDGGAAVTDYEARCRVAGTDTWIGSRDGLSAATETTVGPVTNGMRYECEVRAVNGAGAGEWSRAPGLVEPYGPPPAPLTPTAQAGDGEASVAIASVDGAIVSMYRLECSHDGGASWPIALETARVDAPLQVRPLINGVPHVCRAVATNDRGTSPYSPPSPSFLPCGSVFECNPFLAPLLLALLGIALAVLLWMLADWWSGRARRWIVATVDDLPPVTLGRGPNVAFSYVRDAADTIQQIVPDRGGQADVQVRFLPSDRFEVRAGPTLLAARTGERLELTDASGEAHVVVLRPSARPIREAGPDPSHEDDPFDAGAFSTAGPSDDPW